MTNDSVLTFGKFKGMTVPEVMQEEPSYIAWAHEEGLIHVDKKTLECAMEARYRERADAEAYFESYHDNWGDR